MHIQSNTLLVMVLGGLQFPETSLLGFNEDKKAEEEFFKEMAGRRATVSSNLLQKFAVYYSRHIFDWFKGAQCIHFDFPTVKNQDEWRKFFKVCPDGRFICKRSRLRNMWKEWRHLQACYKFNTIWVSYPLRKALDYAA